MAAPDKVAELVERYVRDRDVYMSDEYNEAQLRREFIDPFFRELGWDVDNTAGWAPAYRDVIHEDSIRLQGSEGGPKAPDYCFRIGGVRKFFVEAKKPAIRVKTAMAPALQLRRYAWSSNLPLSIVTNFDELAVYDCRVQPEFLDGPAVARIMYLTCEEYLDQWDALSQVFSREAILRGSFDRYAEDTRGKHGTSEVDGAFLSEIEGWREALARSFARLNRDLDIAQLGTAVQSTIDRIVFLRICEDRGLDPYGGLRDVAPGRGVYARLLDMFRRADTRYNSGLFHFKKKRTHPQPPDELTPTLKLDDLVLRPILEGLYYPHSPYEFSVFPADILGQVYEQFLGKVITLAPSGSVEVEEKLSARKAGGVYYTPTYVVEYIVEQVLKPVVDRLSLDELDRIKVLDPACGSGSFLLGAYDFLLRWYRDYYIADDVSRWLRAGVLAEGRHGDPKLSTDEKKRILLNNIYGVDIDPQAVEVTKSSACC
jgi:hypothetical protein